MAGLIKQVKYMMFAVILSIFLYGIAFAAPFETVLIVSIDALHPKALGPKTSANIYKLMERGVFTLNGYSTSPPLTLLAHTAMFTGLLPAQSGKTDNTWQPGKQRVKQKTIFNTGKSMGFSTGFFYSKEKLGYLINDAIDSYKMSGDFAVDQAIKFFKKSGKNFCFLHISGLDQAGPEEGWMSPGYMEEFFYIDDAIAPLINTIEDKGNYLIIITSDHAGHDRVHGSDHPDDAKLPLILVSDIVDLQQYQGVIFSVKDLKSILETLLAQ